MLKRTGIALGVVLGLAVTPVSAQETLVCAFDSTADKTLSLNELITTGIGSYKYTEVKVLKDFVDITPFELCMGALPFKNNAFGCIDLGVGSGIWHDHTSIGLFDNDGPLQSPSKRTTFFNPTWITYANKDVMNSSDGQMDTADGQIILRRKDDQRVVDYLCYATDTACSTDAYFSKPLSGAANSQCWNDFVVTENSTKVFGRSEPDGTGDFSELPDAGPTTGTSNDGPQTNEEQLASICSAIDADTFVPLYANNSLALNAASLSIIAKGSLATLSGTETYRYGASVDQLAQYRYGKYLPPNLLAYSGPANSVKQDIALSGQTLTTGNWDQATLISGAATLTSGTYKFNSLTMADNTELKLSAGTYHIGQLSLGENARITLLSGPVNLVIGSGLLLSSNAAIGGTDPGRLNLYLSDNAWLTMASGGLIQGTILGGAASSITLNSNSRVNGSLFSMGNLTVNGTVVIDYSSLAKAAQRSLYSCPAPPPQTTITLTPSTPAAALTCQPQPVAIQVTRSDGTPYSGTLTLQTSSNLGNWFNAAGVALSSLNNGSVSVTFASGDMGQISLALSHLTPATLTITATDTATSSLTATTVPITFSTAGLLWLDDAGNAISVLNPLIMESGTARDVQLRAVKQGTTPGVCTGIFANGALVPIELGSTCSNPSTCSTGQKMQGVNNGTFTLGNPQNTPETASRSLVFGPNSTAVLSLMSPDVGRMDLSARFAGNAQSPVLLGATSGGAITVKPFELRLTNIRTADTASTPNPGTASPTGSLFTAAGNRFYADITASNSLGAVTPNFGRETSTPQPALTAAILAPALGVAGTVTKTGSWIPGAAGSGSLVFDAAAGGQGLSYSEVGAISMTPSLSDYQGAGAVSGQASTIGRFVPDRFEVSATAGVKGDACTQVYWDQPLGFAAPPYLTLSAVNRQGAPTMNYSGSFFKLPSSLPSGAYSLTRTSGGLWTPAMTAIPTWTPQAGGAILQFDNFVLPRLIPATDLAQAPIDDGVSVLLNSTAPGSSLITDTDGVCVQDGTGACAAALTWDLVSTALSWRFGRASMDNNNGSETEDLTMPVRAEYWDGTAWLANDRDNGDCTTLANGDFMLGAWTQATGTPSTTVTSWTGFSLGLGSYDLTAPGAGNTGQVVVTGNVPSWLKSWDGASFNDSPRATAVFGIYRGRPPMLFKAQIFR